jgi:hypothetical protein
MLFRFIGQYTHGRTSIDAGGVLFEGHEPTEVTDGELIRRLTSHVEFEAVEAGEAPPVVLKKRGRPKKVAD